MAHSEKNRWGRKNLRFKPGHKIGMMVGGKLVTGTVGHVDGGDWIYPSIPGGPGWCRSSQVIDMESP